MRKIAKTTGKSKSSQMNRREFTVAVMAGCPVSAPRPQCWGGTAYPTHKFAEEAVVTGCQFITAIHAAMDAHREEAGEACDCHFCNDAGPTAWSFMSHVALISGIISPSDRVRAAEKARPPVIPYAMAAEKAFVAGCKFLDALNAVVKKLPHWAKASAAEDDQLFYEDCQQMARLLDMHLDLLYCDVGNHSSVILARFGKTDCYHIALALEEERYEDAAKLVGARGSAATV